MMSYEQIVLWSHVVVALGFVGFAWWVNRPCNRP